MDFLVLSPCSCEFLVTSLIYNYYSKCSTVYLNILRVLLSQISLFQESI